MVRAGKLYFCIYQNTRRHTNEGHNVNTQRCKNRISNPTSMSPPLTSTKPSCNPYGHTYGIQLWGTASNSNIDTLERFQAKVLRIITDAPWYVPNAVIKHDLQMPSVRQEMRTFSVTNHARLEGHSNDLATSLLQQPPHNHRLKRYYSADQATRF
jgi:hypothetical protein